MRADPFLARLSALLLCASCSAPALADSATTQLRIAVGVLRSQAAELELLQAQSRRAGLPERTVRGHAIQLRRAVERARQQLDEAPAPASAEGIRGDARAAAQQLLSLVTALSITGTPAAGTQAASAVPPLRERLQRDEAALPH